MSRAVLDSSPIPSQIQNVAAPGVGHSRPLKRSASTASLLTPPATVEHKRHASKSRSQSLHDSDIDSDVEVDARPARRQLKFGRKNNRTERLDAVLASLDGEDDENSFWTSDSQTLTDRPTKRQKTVIRAPISPPPSKRQASLPETPKLSSPRTPTADSGIPRRDTPNNPFLDGSPMSVSGDVPEPTTPTRHVEKPFVTYVYRGVRTTFANDLYGITDEERAKSQLPLEHPDYSPDPVCPPTRLFSDIISRRHTSPTRQRQYRSKDSSSMKSKKVHLPTDWDDSDDDELHLTPPSRIPQNSQ